MSADFLDEPGLYVTNRPPITNIAGDACQWCDPQTLVKCNNAADHMAISKITGRGAWLCKEHAEISADILVKRAASAVSQLRLSRAERKAEAFRKRNHGESIQYEVKRED